MRTNEGEGRTAFLAASRIISDALGRFEKAFPAANTDNFKRHLYGGKIVVKTGLPDSKDVGYVLRGCAIIAAIGENAGGRVDDFRRTAVRIAFAQPRL